MYHGVLYRLFCHLGVVIISQFPRVLTTMAGNYFYSTIIREYKNANLKYK